MLTTNEIQDAIRRAGYRARRRIHDGELDCYTGTVGQVMTQVVMMAEGLAALDKLDPPPTGLNDAFRRGPWKSKGQAKRVYDTWLAQRPEGASDGD